MVFPSKSRLNAPINHAEADRVHGHHEQYAHDFHIQFRQLRRSYFATQRNSYDFIARIFVKCRGKDVIWCGVSVTNEKNGYPMEQFESIR
jgi:hypothetical protein